MYLWTPTGHFLKSGWKLLYFYCFAKSTVESATCPGSDLTLHNTEDWKSCMAKQTHYVWKIPITKKKRTKTHNKKALVLLQKLPCPKKIIFHFSSLIRNVTIISQLEEFITEGKIARQESPNAVGPTDLSRAPLMYICCNNLFNIPGGLRGFRIQVNNFRSIRVNKSVVESMWLHATCLPLTCWLSWAQWAEWADNF